jgi:cell fate regulator YaaT (PSP1 superfamily)
VIVPQLIEVAFKGNRKEFFLWEADEAPPLRAPVIVDADRGEDLGLVHASGELAAQRSARVPHGLLGAPPAHVAKRVATAEDVRRLDEVRAQDDDARRRAMERVKANSLVMKVTDAEWQWDRKKLTFYFTAEKRVDFRTLVRELASMFRTRIELKQIGVRDEAKRLDGVGRCGRQYCSASWLPELRPVNLGVAKDQRLSLNPSQISGACGRLMCCLRYEHEFYVQSRKKYPKEGKPVRTARGEEKVLANDIFRERVMLRGVDGEVRTLALAALREEMLAAGDALAHALTHAAAAAELAAAAPPLPVHELQSEEEEISPEEALDTEHSPDHLAGIGAAIDPALDVTMEWPAPRPQQEGRRPQRRRGRRGGRRNRPGGANGARGPQDDGAPSEGDQ